MRVWDCCPSELARVHLGGEWNEIHAVWSAVWRRREGVRINPETGRRYGWLSHPETVRFLSRPLLLVARLDFLAAEGRARGYRYVAPLTVELPGGRVVTSDAHRVSDAHDTFDGDWYGFRVAVKWPKLSGRYWSPWQRDGYDYDHYRHRSPYADLN